MELLRKLGGNSVRTWGADELGKTLDEAQRNGLTVAAGIWLGHERHGFRYENPDQVNRQRAHVREVVERYRNHPALLLWSLGNEMEGDGSREEIWREINFLARTVKELDPDHPVMTVIAEVGGSKVANLHRLCPDVDIVGINSYAGASTLERRYREAGGTKPYLLAEFGPPGTWEVAKTPWGAPVEPTSTEKAEWYRRSWTANVGRSSLCLGGYAFLWGHKQETTPTWFGMLLSDGNRLAAADAMGELWTGRPPTNRCPVIERLAVAGNPERKPGDTMDVPLKASDLDDDRLRAEWVVMAEAIRTGTGGDREDKLPSYPQSVVEGSLTGARIRCPDRPGAYRVYVYVRDGKGGAATGNVPFRVVGDPTPPSRRASLPLVIYDEAGRAHLPWVPSGWMGDTASIAVDDAWTRDPASGKTCMRCRFTASSGWGGVVWQDPPNDWGDLPGGWELRGAKRLVWKARGETGGEEVTFLFGLLGADKRYPDSAAPRKLSVRLASSWRTYEIEIKHLNLERIKTGFGWTVESKGKPVRFYLDDIVIE